MMHRVLLKYQANFTYKNGKELLNVNEIQSQINRVLRVTYSKWCSFLPHFFEIHIWQWFETKAAQPRLAEFLKEGIFID